MPKDVFISHASQDAPAAAAVCRGLEARGLRCWIAPRDIRSGESWGASIVHALDECPVLVLVLTAHANASRQVPREVERADNKRARIVNFRLENVALNPTLEYFLSADHWFDATQGPLDGHLPALAQTVQALLATGRGTARPPDAARPLAPSDDRALVRAFDELAPDDWSTRPGSTVGRWLNRLLADR
jgi:TIR domain